MKKYNITKTNRRYMTRLPIFSILVAVCMLFSGRNSYAQENTSEIIISGKITDAFEGKPLLGARVQLAEQDASAIADAEGVFSIKVPSTWGVLVVSAPDYTTREVPIQGRLSIDIQLYSSIFSSGYERMEVLEGVKRKSILTNPANIASGFDLSYAISAESEIQSRLGGDVRTITRSGISGIGASMFIRGFNSLNAKAQPLIIVDGVIMDNQLNNSSIHEGFFSNPLTNINVKDIESISVIKDGNTIYGSKAANGVILINTVRAKSQTTRIAANVSVGLNMKPKLPKMMNASEYRVYATNQIQGFLDYNHPGISLTPANFLRIFPFTDADPTKSYYKKYHNDTDWSDEVYHNGLVQNYGLSVSGGDDIALYYLSMNYTGSDNTIKNTGMQRLSARFNTDIRMSSKLFATIDMNISRTTRDLRDDGIDRVTSPGFLALVKAPILNPHNYLLSGELSSSFDDYDQIDPSSSYGYAMSNPAVIIEDALGSATRVGFDIKANPYYQFNKNLKVGASFNYGLDRVKESFFLPETGIAPRVLENIGGTARNEVRDLTQRHISLFIDTRVDWTVYFNREHRLALLGGYRFISDDYESDIPRGYNTGNDNVKIMVEGLGYITAEGFNDNWKSMSWYVNAAYDYQNKYFLTLTGSADASSRFGKETDGGIKLFGQNWALFPSAEAGWLISSENFMQNLSAINFLKLRVGFGMTGNDDIPSLTGLSYFKPVKMMGSAVGLEIADIANEAIQWETTQKMNAGLDIHLFNERLALSADFFQSKTDNLLTQKALKSITGLGYYWANAGKLENRGFEASFDLKLLNLRNLKWELGASIGHYKNEITALPDGNYTTEIYGANVLTSTGNPAGVFYGYKTDGVFATTAEAESAGLYKLNANGSKTYYSAGDVRFVDNGDKVIDANDMQIIGDPNPDFYGTITNRFNMKRFTLDVLFTYSYGNDVYNYLRSQLESGTNFYNQSKAMLGRWSYEGQLTSMPKAVYGDPMGNNVFSDRWIEDGSYLRLKTVSLSYELPVRIPYLQGLTVWAAANNVWTWTKYLGSDPEFSISNSVLYQGIDAGLTPQGRSYYLGVKFNL